MSNKEKQEQLCGLIMPISSIDGCSEAHWLDVKKIITDSITSSGFKANLVSDADDVGVIQKRIIQNIYDNPIVVCDVSCKNPNVMFELGMRLAFDKPTIIIKDDKTSYTFDTSNIEHLEYPRDLRFNKIIEFKEKLKDKILATIKATSENKNYTTFLGHFGKFNVANIETKDISKEDYIIEELNELKLVINKNTRHLNMQKRQEENSSIIDSTLIEAILNNLQGQYEFRSNMNNRDLADLTKDVVDELSLIFSARDVHNNLSKIKHSIKVYLDEYIPF